MKNSKIMKKITLGSATVLSAFTLATAVVPTFATTVHADDVTSVSDSNTQEWGTKVSTPTYDVYSTIKYDTTKVTPANETGRFINGGYISDGYNWTWEGDNTEIPEGYEEDPNYTPYYRDVEDVFGMTSAAIRFYRPIANPDTPSAPTTDTPAPSQGQDTPSAPTTDTPAPSQNPDTPSAPTTDTPAPSQGQDTPSAPTTDTPAPSQNQDTPSAPTTDTPASNVEKTEEEAPTAPTAENVTPTSTPKEEKVADTNTKASTTQETSKEGTLPKAGDASLLSMILGSTLLGGVSFKRFGKKNK